MPAPQFTGKYASIRKDFWKGSLGTKYPGEKDVYVGNHKWSKFKTEKGYYNAMAKKFSNEMAIIDKIENANLPLEATLTIDWKKGDMGAWQAKANLNYNFINANGQKDYKHLESNRTGGWGYDKASSASAVVLNASPQFMRILMDARAKKKKLPYGAQLKNGEPWFPYWEGGVGIECHNHILEVSGYDVKQVRTGRDDIQIYNYTLKKRRA